MMASALGLAGTAPAPGCDAWRCAARGPGPCVQALQWSAGVRALHRQGWAEGLRPHVLVHMPSLHGDHCSFGIREAQQQPENLLAGGVYLH
jgi:hypothetical protein